MENEKYLVRRQGGKIKTVRKLVRGEKEPKKNCYPDEEEKESEGTSAKQPHWKRQDTG